MSAAGTADDDRRRLLAALLTHAAFDGWSDRALHRAAADAGLAQDDIRLLFPKGMRDILAFHAQELDRALQAAAPALDLPAMKIRARIKTLVQTRILLMNPHREAARRAMLTLALPGYGDIAVKGLCRSVDLMWRLCGDSATDWNYYSKRAILSGVYSATLLYWFSDQSADYVESWAFLDRRIENVMRIEKAKADLRAKVGKLPSFSRLLGRLRYPRLET